MTNKFNNPFVKLFTGLAFILIAVFIRVLGKYEFLQISLEISGLVLELFAVIGFYYAYKKKAQ
jgi:hypothetical protein